jgi:hypothetical protein
MDAWRYVAGSTFASQRHGAHRVANLRILGTSERLTHEHLWPASLHSRLIAPAHKAASRFWLRKIGRLEKEIQNEPTVRDCRCVVGPC